VQDVEFHVQISETSEDKDLEHVAISFHEKEPVLLNAFDVKETNFDGFLNASVLYSEYAIFNSSQSKAAIFAFYIIDEPDVRHIWIGNSKFPILSFFKTHC